MYDNVALPLDVTSIKDDRNYHGEFCNFTYRFSTANTFSSIVTLYSLQVSDQVNYIQAPNRCTVIHDIA